MADKAGDVHRRPRVLLVTSGFPRWSGDHTAPFVLHLAQDLRVLGWDVRVLAPMAPGALDSETICEVPVERFPYFWPCSSQTLCYEGGALVKLRSRKRELVKVPPFIVSQWYALSRRLRRHSFNLVHSHWILPQAFTAAMAAGPLRIPHLATVHGSDVFALQGRVLRACKRFALQHADAVTVNSSATLEETLRIAPDVRPVCIPMGSRLLGAGDFADAGFLRARYRQGIGPLIVFVGRLVPEKGVDDLLAAAALLRRDLPDATVLIVGDGPDKLRLERMTDELSISQRVNFVGAVAPDKVAAHCAAADIFVGPSKRLFDGVTEAQGVTFAEAMLARVPVVATGVGGIVDLVRQEETGLVVSESSPPEIANAILRLHCTPDLADRLRRNGYELAIREFTRTASAARFSELYGELVSRGTRDTSLRSTRVSSSDRTQ